MKAIVYTKYGTPDVLELKEVDKPVPKDDEVLIKVSAVSINDSAQGRCCHRPQSNFCLLLVFHFKRNMMRSILFLFVCFFCSPFDSTAQSDEDEPDDFAYDKSTHSVKFSDTLFYGHDSTKILKRLGNYFQDHRFQTDNQKTKTFHRKVSFEVHARENRGKANNVLGNVEYLLTVEIKKTDIIVTYTDFLFIDNHQKKGRLLDKTFPNKLEVFMERERVKAMFYKMLD